MYIVTSPVFPEKFIQDINVIAPFLLVSTVAPPHSSTLCILLYTRICNSREERLKEGLLAAVSVPLKLAAKANTLWPTLTELASVANIACKSDLQVFTVVLKSAVVKSGSKFIKTLLAQVKLANE